MTTQNPTRSPDWSETEVQIALFRAIVKNRPVGMAKHFAIIGMQRSLEESLGIVIDTAEIWTELDKLYDMDALEEMVCI